jgi:hypothetical protein
VFARAPHFDGIRGIDGDARSGVFRSTPVRRLSRRLPLETDMRGTLFAFLYEPDLRTTVLTKWLDHRGRGPECVVVEADEGRSPEGDRLSGAAIAGGFVYWIHVVFPDPVVTGVEERVNIRRRRIPTRRCRQRGPEERGRSLEQLASSPAVDRARLYFTSPRGVVQTPLSSAGFTP